MRSIILLYVLSLLVVASAAWYNWSDPAAEPITGWDRPKYEGPRDHPHKVRNLPGAPAEPSFDLYAGFIPVDIDNARHSVFYVLCETIRADPLEAPLVVWLNGGPGSSSLLGFSLENGPYLLNATTGELRYNDLSWNQYANVLYIESPDGVGFSKSNRSEKRYDDDFTANLTMKTMQEFFTRTHPRYAARDFFVAGESYAGAYIPYLTRAILGGIRLGTFVNKHFRGIAMGNAEMDSYSRLLSSAMQMYAMGTIPQRYGPILFKIWKNITDGDTIEGDAINWKLAEVPSDFFQIYGALNRSVYNLYLTCEKEEDEKIWHIPRVIRNMECTQIEAADVYFNRKDVQKALNVYHENGNKVVQWSAASASVKEAYVIPRDIVPLYKDIFDLIEGDFRILYYSGDLDLVCPAIHTARGARLIASRTGMVVRQEEQHYPAPPKIWTYLGDFGGAKTSYELASKSITMDVLTVRGAGHFAIVNHPSRTFQIINNFLFSNNTKIDYSAKIRRRKYFISKSASASKSIDRIEGSGQSAELLSKE